MLAPRLVVKGKRRTRVKGQVFSGHDPTQLILQHVKGKGPRDCLLLKSINTLYILYKLDTGLECVSWGTDGGLQKTLVMPAGSVWSGGSQCCLDSGSWGRGVR